MSKWFKLLAIYRFKMLFPIQWLSRVDFWTKGSGLNNFCNVFARLEQSLVSSVAWTGLGWHGLQ